MATKKIIKYGLIGKSLSHSFSKQYFSEKFKSLNLPYKYELFETASVKEFLEELKSLPDLEGFNITIPYKQEIIEYLDVVDDFALAANAVNTVKISGDKLYGFNTDILGFEISLINFLKENKIDKSQISSALVLGTGGASNAVEVVLKRNGIASKKVSRKPSARQLSYEDLNQNHFDQCQMIINCTPLGTYPVIEAFPPIPYEHIKAEHILYDLVYNPEKTVFLKKGEQKSAFTINGLNMLHIQAEEAWKIWNDMDLNSKSQSKNNSYKAIDFENTEIAFSAKSDKQLKKAKLLFSTMNKAWLVNLLSPLGDFAIKYNLPFAKSITKNTIFEQFVGGTSFDEVQATVQNLWKFKTQSILDYGVEAKENESDFDSTMRENIKAVEFAAANESVPVVSTKITGLAKFELLEHYNASTPSSLSQKEEMDRARERLIKICEIAAKKGSSIFIDAEESWIQDSIDQLTDEMMERYNKERAVVFNTFQLYRHDRLAFLKASHEKAQKGNYILGAKLVRGAYMHKERERAEEMKYESPIHKTKAAVDEDYDDAIRYCIDHIEEIACCVASHNQKSTALFAELIHNKKMPNDHPHVSFCQLYGMSDNLTFNLASAGYNVAKYLPYGPVKDVVPYLIRRARENSSVTGDMSREFKLITKEMKRRMGN